MFQTTNQICFDKYLISTCEWNCAPRSNLHMWWFYTILVAKGLGDCSQVRIPPKLGLRQCKSLKHCDLSWFDQRSSGEQHNNRHDFTPKKHAFIMLSWDRTCSFSQLWLNNLEKMGPHDDDDEQRPVGEDRRIHWLTRSGWFMRPPSLQLILLWLVVDLPLWKMMEFVRLEKIIPNIGENKTANQLLFKASGSWPRETSWRDFIKKISRWKDSHIRPGEMGSRNKNN